MSDLTPREDELLRYIRHWRSSHGPNTTVDRKWIEQKMVISTTWLSDLKKGLVEKGFLVKNRKDFVFTEEAAAYLGKVVSTNSHIVSPTYLPLRGQVRAGRTKQDELRIDLADLPDHELVTIPIPNLDSDLGAFVLKVVGISMEHERIFEDDYVIVQPYKNGRMPKQRDLIVTYYLPPRHEKEVEDLPDMDMQWFDGPTLKYYTEISGKERPFRLSWRRDIEKSEYTIETKRIAPVGKVVGIYRPIVR